MVNVARTWVSTWIPTNFRASSTFSKQSRGGDSATICEFVVAGIHSTLTQSPGRRRFISDYMGRSPLITDTEHMTHLRMDVDEDVFTPACTTIPLPRSPLSLSEPNSSDFKYFGLKCRYVFRVLTRSVVQVFTLVSQLQSRAVGQGHQKTFSP